MNKKKDGDFYKRVKVFGGEFDIYYGYYDERERQSKYSEPMPIYPNFIKDPIYNPDGYLFATEMQDVCPYYDGKPDIDSCYGCRSFRKGEELIGLCLNSERKKQPR